MKNRFFFEQGTDISLTTQRKLRDILNSVTLSVEVCQRNKRPGQRHFPHLRVSRSPQAARATYTLATDQSLRSNLCAMDSTEPCNDLVQRGDTLELRMNGYTFYFPDVPRIDRYTPV